MRREEKHQLVKEWADEYKDVPYAVLVDYRGINVAQATELRRKIRESGSTYRVVKNTLARISVPGTKLEALKEHFVGPVAITTNTEDPVVMAKVLIDFAKANPQLEIKVGVVDGEVLQEEQIKELSMMPGREELLAKLLYLMQYPIQGFAVALNGVIRNLAVTLDQVAQQKETAN